MSHVELAFLLWVLGAGIGVAAGIAAYLSALVLSARRRHRRYLSHAAPGPVTLQSVP